MYAGPMRGEASRAICPGPPAPRGLPHPPRSHKNR